MNTLKETKEKIKVMEAFLDGKEIECKKHNGNLWVDNSDPAWDWSNCDYRIKDQKHKFKIGDEIVCRTQAEMPIYKTMTITGVTDYGYILEIGSKGQKPAKSSIKFDEAQEYLLADEVLWYWEIICKDDNTYAYTMASWRFKTEQELREHYGKSLKFKCKRMLSLGFIIPKELSDERD